jgi:uncharacterized protein YdhG (YjbR/CyaY superfamily)
MSTKPQTIDEYLVGLPREQRVALEAIREAIKAAAPRAEECISYSLPAFRLDGKVLVGFGATSRHCAFHPMSGTIAAKHKADLSGYDTSKGTIRFQPEKPLSRALVRKLVKSRIAEMARPRRSGGVREHARVSSRKRR